MSAEHLRLKALALELRFFDLLASSGEDRFEKQEKLGGTQEKNRVKVRKETIKCFSTFNRISCRRDKYLPCIWLKFGYDERVYYTNQTPINTSFSGRLQYLQRQAKHAQYLLACLSTLGGANHLCNKPLEALALARQQEVVGHKLGSTDIVLRARAFQAVNYALLGAEGLAHSLLGDCVDKARTACRESTLTFVQNMWTWLQRELEDQHKQKEQFQNKTDSSVGSISGSLTDDGQWQQRLRMLTARADQSSPLQGLLHYKYSEPASTTVLTTKGI